MFSSFRLTFNRDQGSKRMHPSVTCPKNDFAKPNIHLQNTQKGNCALKFCPCAGISRLIPNPKFCPEYGRDLQHVPKQLVLQNSQNTASLIQRITGESKRSSAIDALGSHLVSIGLNVESKEHVEGVETSLRSIKDRLTWGSAWGTIRIANRNVDLIQLGFVRADTLGFFCSYLVEARVEGLEQKFKAKLRTIRQGLLRRKVVDLRWEGQELAQLLNNDSVLKRKNEEDLARSLNNISRLRKDPLSLQSPGRVNIVSYKDHKYVRILPRLYSFPLEAAFPTFGTYEAYEEIAGHVRSIACC